MWDIIPAFSEPVKPVCLYWQKIGGAGQSTVKNLSRHLPVSKAVSSGPEPPAQVFWLYISRNRLPW